MLSRITCWLCITYIFVTLWAVAHDNPDTLTYPCDPSSGEYLWGNDCYGN